MPITAIALLRISPAQLPPLAGKRVQELDDAVLLHTGENFAREPAELSLALHALLGGALDLHQDARGIFFVPDVAAPSARSYEQVVAEVGEGGVWAPLVDALGDEAEGGDLGALLGNLLGQMPSSLLAAANAAAHGQPGAIEAMSAQLSQLMSKSSELQGLAAQFAGMLDQATPPSAPGARPADAGIAPGGNIAEQMAQMAEALAGSGFDLSAPAMQELGAKIEAEFERAQPPAPDAAPARPSSPSKPNKPTDEK
jgi:hypothetical protein